MNANSSIRSSNARLLIRLAGCVGMLVLVLGLLLQFGGVLTQPIGGSAQKATNSPPQDPNRERPAPLPVELAHKTEPVEPPKPPTPAPPVQPRAIPLLAENTENPQPAPTPSPTQEESAIQLDRSNLPPLDPKLVAQLRTNQAFSVRALFDPESDVRRWIQETRLMTFAFAPASNRVVRLARDANGGHYWKLHSSRGSQPLGVSVPLGMVPAAEQAHSLVGGKPMAVMALTSDLEESLFRQLGTALSSARIQVSSNLVAVGRLFESPSGPAFELTELGLPGKPAIRVTHSSSSNMTPRMTPKRVPTPVGLQWTDLGGARMESSDARH